MRRNRRDPPAWKLELLRQIDSLAQLPGAVDVFNRHVQAVAESLASEKTAKDALPELAEGKVMSSPEYHAKYSLRDLLGPGPGLTLPEKFFILAAFHDVLCEAERMAPIAVWDLPELPEAAEDPRYPALVMYLHYGSQCADLPDHMLQPDVLRRYVEDVKAELPNLPDQASKEQTEDNPDMGKRTETVEFADYPELLRLIAEKCQKHSGDIARLSVMATFDGDAIALDVNATQSSDALVVFFEKPGSGDMQPFRHQLFDDYGMTGNATSGFINYERLLQDYLRQQQGDPKQEGTAHTLVQQTIINPTGNVAGMSTGQMTYEDKSGGGPKKKSWFKDHWVGFLWAVLATVIAGLVLFWLTRWLDMKG